MFHCQHSAHCSSIHSHVCLRAGCKLKERLCIQARDKQHPRRFGPTADHRSSPMFCCGKLEPGRHLRKRHYPNGLRENTWNQINLNVTYTGSETESCVWVRRFWSIAPSHLLFKKPCLFSPYFIYFLVLYLTLTFWSTNDTGILSMVTIWHSPSFMFTPRYCFLLPSTIYIIHPYDPWPLPVSSITKS